MINLKPWVSKLNNLDKRIKIALLVFLMLIIVWQIIKISAKGLENFVYHYSGGSILEKTIDEINVPALPEQLKPIRNWGKDHLEIKSRSALSILADERNKVLFEKESKRVLPIASITKLMTALIVIENYNLEEEIELSHSALLQERRLLGLQAGERFKTKELLYPLLMESSNSIAYALAEKVGIDEFIFLMNQKAQELELINTYFINPTGLDPEIPSERTNSSNAYELSLLVEYLLDKDLIWDILKTSNYRFVSSSGLSYQLSNTNEFLNLDNRPLWASEIKGGKTGWTFRAQECLILVVNSPRGYLINIILGSENRFEEMKKLVDWSYDAYIW